MKKISNTLTFSGIVPDSGLGKAIKELIDRLPVDQAKKFENTHMIMAENDADGSPLTHLHGINIAASVLDNKIGARVLLFSNTSLTRMSEILSGPLNKVLYSDRARLVFCPPTEEFLLSVFDKTKEEITEAYKIKSKEVLGRD